MLISDTENNNEYARAAENFGDCIVNGGATIYSTDIMLHLWLT